MDIPVFCLFSYVKCELETSSRRLEVVGERENGRARGRHARGEGVPARKAPENRFNSLFVRSRLPREKLTARAEKTVNQ